MDFLLILAKLLLLSLNLNQLFLQTDTFGATGGFYPVCKILHGSAITSLHLMDIVRAHTGDSVRTIAVQVDQTLEAILLARVKHPVDRPFLVDLQVILIEVVQEVLPDQLTGSAAAIRIESGGDELQIVFQLVRAKDRLDPVHKHRNHIIREIVVIGDGQHSVFICGIGHILCFIPFAARKYQTGFIQRVAAQHAADGTGDQAADVTAQISLTNGHILIRHFRCQFILQAVDVDEDTVEFLFVGFQVLETQEGF